MDETTSLRILENIFDNFLNNKDKNSWVLDAEGASHMAKEYLKVFPTAINRDCFTCSEKELLVEHLEEQIQAAAYLQVVYEYYLKQTRLHIEAAKQPPIYEYSFNHLNQNDTSKLQSNN